MRRYRGQKRRNMRLKIRPKSKKSRFSTGQIELSAVIVVRGLTVKTTNKCSAPTPKLGLPVDKT